MQSRLTSSNGTFPRNRVQTVFDFDQVKRIWIVYRRFSGGEGFSDVSYINQYLLFCLLSDVDLGAKLQLCDELFYLCKWT